MVYSSTGFLLKNIFHMFFIKKDEWDASSESFMWKFSLWGPKLNADTRIFKSDTTYLELLPSYAKSFCASILVTESNMWKQTAQWSKLRVKVRVFKPSGPTCNIQKDWKFSH